MHGAAVHHLWPQTDTSGDVFLNVWRFPSKLCGCNLSRAPRRGNPIVQVWISEKHR